MNYSRADVNVPVEPTLFPGGALSITLEALLDPEDHTVLFVVRGWDVGADKMIALWSSSPQPFENYTQASRRAHTEFSTLVEAHSGPFA